MSTKENRLLYMHAIDRVCGLYSVLYRTGCLNALSMDFTCRYPCKVLCQNLGRAAIHGKSDLNGGKKVETVYSLAARECGFSVSIFHS